MMMRLCLSMLMIVMFCSIVGCTKKAKPRPVQPTKFELNETGPLVTEEVMFKQLEKRSVKADFNQDNLQDYAIIEEDESGVNQISIYLQRESRDLEKTYLQAGGIHQVGEYTISVIMAQDSGGGTDLGILYKYPGDIRELVHYRIEGDSIEEVMRSAP